MTGLISSTGRRETPDGMWLLPDITQETWREDAACSFHETPQLWDPTDRHGRFGPNDKVRWAQAASVCATCPVALQCAAAVTPQDAGGIRAGLLVDRRGRVGRIPPVVAPPKAKPLPPAACGGAAAKARHRRNGGEDCSVCWPNGKTIRGLAPCGSREARSRHRRNNEDCQACGITQDSHAA